MDNMVLWSGILLVSGFVLGSLRRLPAQIWSLIERHLCFSLHVNDDDEAFYWIKLWVSQKINPLSVTAYTRKQEMPNDIDASDIDKYKYIFSEGQRDKRPVPIFVPAPGTYFFKHEGKYCWVTFERKEGDGAQALQKVRESFVIHILTRDKSIGSRILFAARDIAIPMDGKVEVRMASTYNWQLVTRLIPRPLESIVLDQNVAFTVLEDLQTFLKSSKWYSELGVPYRRSILLYGPPGGGKSSLALGLASELGMNINILPLNTPGMTDAKLIDLLGQCDSHTIVLIEDIDCAFEKRAKSDSKIDSLTFSGLLNALDGVAAHGGRITILTTNHPEKLDAALTRDGRADLRIFIDHATQEQASRLFARFFPDSDKAEEFGRLIPNRKISMAAIQGHIMKHRHSPNDCITNIKSLEEQIKI